MPKYQSPPCRFTEPDAYGGTARIKEPGLQTDDVTKQYNLYFDQKRKDLVQYDHNYLTFLITWKENLSVHVFAFENKRRKQQKKKKKKKELNCISAGIICVSGLENTRLPYPSQDPTEGW